MNHRWRITAIVLAVVAIGQGVELHRVNSALKNVFHYDVKATLKDADTGEVIRGGSIQGPGTSTDDLFHQSTTYGGGMEAREISGIAYEPREFSFGANGYTGSNVVVTDDTPSSIIIELEAKKTKAEQGSGGDP